MLPRCGRAAHICEANCILQSVFPAAIALFKAFKFKQSCIMRIKTVNSSKATGQLQHAGRQKQGWAPLLPDVEDRFPKEQVLLRKTNCIQFGKAGAHPQLALGIAIAPETLFSHCNLLILMAIAILCDSLLDFCLRFSIRFYLLRKCGLLAHTSPTFLKNCWIKKLLVACGSYLTINSFLQISCQMHQNCKCCLRCSFTPQNPLSQPHRIKSSCLCCFCLLRVKSAFAANPQSNLFFSSQWNF